MARSRAVEQKNLVRRALRAVRRVYRTLDSLGEVFERRLDRMVERKTQVYAEELDPLIKDFYNLKAQNAALEKALADAVGIASY